MGVMPWGVDDLLPVRVDVANGGLALLALGHAGRVGARENRGGQGIVSELGLDNVG